MGGHRKPTHFSMQTTPFRQSKKTKAELELLKVEYALGGMTDGEFKRRCVKLLNQRKFIQPDRPKVELCESCGVRPEKPLFFDHCHRTHKFRGWICNGCNTALGFCKDDPRILRALASYQDKFLNGPTFSEHQRYLSEGIDISL